MKRIALLTILALSACDTPTTQPGTSCPDLMEPHEAIRQLNQLQSNIDLIRASGQVPIELLHRAARLGRCIVGGR